MFRDEEVLVKINSRNIKYYLEKGYEFEIPGFNESREYIVKTKDIPENSHFKINVLCELCGSVNLIGVNKYYMNYNRNNKGYYSCFKCKNTEKEKTCIQKYGVSSYSKTDQFKSTESEKWKGIQKGAEKGRKTMLERYGVDSYFKTDEMKEKNRKWMSSDEFKSKSKDTLLEKFGVDSFSKTSEFKHIIQNKKTEIVQKIKNTCLEKYGVEWISYIDEFIQKSIETRKKSGNIIPPEKLTEFQIYKKQVRTITNRNKKRLFEEWNGCDYYDGEFIQGYFAYSSKHRLYPTIDHKISCLYGFLNDISVEIVGDLSNLCITKKFINCAKRELVEEVFITKMESIIHPNN
jgi:hypothetical protein